MNRVVYDCVDPAPTNSSNLNADENTELS